MAAMPTKKPQFNLKSDVAKTKLRDEKGHFVKQAPQPSEVKAILPSVQNTPYMETQAVIVNESVENTLKAIVELLTQLKSNKNGINLKNSVYSLLVLAALLTLTIVLTREFAITVHITNQ